MKVEHVAKGTVVWLKAGGHCCQEDSRLMRDNDRFPRFSSTEALLQFPPRLQPETVPATVAQNKIRQAGTDRLAIPLTIAATRRRRILHRRPKGHRPPTGRVASDSPASSEWPPPDCQGPATRSPTRCLATGPGSGRSMAGKHIHTPHLPTKVHPVLRKGLRTIGRLRRTRCRRPATIRCCKQGLPPIVLGVGDIDTGIGHRLKSQVDPSVQVRATAVHDTNVCRGSPTNGHWRLRSGQELDSKLQCGRTFR